MIRVERLCDYCGEKMPPIKSLNDLIIKSATQVWDMHLFDICPTCALKLDNTFLRMKLQHINTGDLKDAWL